MRIVVSACLLGEKCKYNGGDNRNARVIDFVQGHEVIPVCPERAAGMPSPRPPVERNANRPTPNSSAKMIHTAAPEPLLDWSAGTFSALLLPLTSLAPAEPVTPPNSAL